MHKTITSILINLLGIAYFGVLVIATAKVLTGLGMQITHFIEAFTQGWAMKSFLNPLEVLTYIISLVLLLYLWKKAGKALRSLIAATKATKAFFDRLPRYYSEKLDCYILRTDKLLVFAAGLFRVKVYISEGVVGLLNNSELEAVLLHENYHASQYDPFRNLICRFLNEATLWLPFKNTMLKNYETIVELSADFYAKEKMLTERHLLRALRKLLDLERSPQLTLSSFSPTVERIPILTGKSTLKYQSSYFFLITVVVFLFSLGVKINSVDPFSDCRDFRQCISSVFTKEQSVENEKALGCMDN